jgi:aminomuconate-semialdehyde/2-hydroxymuconate-6-semialdehyde dehydrogenase
MRSEVFIGDWPDASGELRSVGRGSSPPVLRPRVTPGFVFNGRSYLSMEMEMHSILNYVGGRFVEGAAGFNDVNPIDGSVVATVHEADAALVDHAVRAARAAMNGPYGSSSVSERVQWLRTAADIAERRFDELLEAEVADTGKTHVQARTLDVARAASNFRSFADTLASAGMTSYMTDLPGGGRALNYALHKPLGVVAVIVPWNLPLLLLTWKVAPAIACGNAVVVKPSEETPATATLLAEILEEAGVPTGVYNVVHGFGRDSAGQYLTEHPDIDGVTFTGSTATGVNIMRTVAPLVRPVSFELGGKNAALVFADTNMDDAIAGLTRSIFTNAGQVCLCTERVYIQRPIFDEVVSRLAESTRNLRLGRPEDPATTTGPLISQAHRQKVQKYVELATEAGATTVVGGGIPDLGADLASGSWFEPTLWTGLTNDTRPMREEVFGPVAGLVPFDTEEEGIRLANDTKYGLAASVWTTDLARGHRVAQQMRVGIAWVNTWYLRDLRSPFGGVGLSGIGREGGTYSMHFYTETTNVCVNL